MLQRHVEFNILIYYAKYTIILYPLGSKSDLENSRLHEWQWLRLVLGLEPVAVSDSLAQSPEAEQKRV